MGRLYWLYIVMWIIYMYIFKYIHVYVMHKHIYIYQRTVYEDIKGLYDIHLYIIG